MPSRRFLRKTRRSRKASRRSRSRRRAQRGGRPGSADIPGGYPTATVVGKPFSSEVGDIDSVPTLMSKEAYDAQKPTGETAATTT